MDKKNTMLLTIVAVATLLVAVVGATFAYFSVTGSTTSTNSVVTTTAEKVGVVSLTQGTENFYLNLTAAQMANTTAAKIPYYATTTDTAAATSYTATEIAKVSVTGGTSDVTYYCNFDYTITTTGADTNQTGALDILKTDGKLIITSGTGVDGIAGTYVLGTDVTNGTGTVTLTGETSASINAYAQFTNTSENQSAMSGASFTTTVKITGFSCDTTQAGA